MIKTLLNCYKIALEKQKQNPHINYSVVIKELDNAFNDFMTIHRVTDEDLLSALIDLKANEPESVLYDLYVSTSENINEMEGYTKYLKRYYKMMKERGE